MRRPLLSTLALVSSLSSLTAQDAWDALVRGTDARTPQEQRAGFHLPPGFEIQLVASEPQIAKPMNLAFDAKGRLWVSDTLEYPWALADGKRGRDAVKVLTIGTDGAATSITTFVDGLNIPIGLYPYKDGVIAFDIPTIKFHRDTDGDGKADKTEKLYGTFGRDDTHGMTNAFRRGPDGWLYACHGFKNKSTISGADGSSITMTSGSTYRMRVDGSRVERHTHGQVNPFGMAFDDWGNLFTSDCHSKPIYQVLRGAWYPSFGAPHDGLGYGPEMMAHMHGSTGLCGFAWYGAEQFPAEFRNNAFVCNVVTSKVNRDFLEPIGSTRNAKELADFVTSDDPWFRPVDLTVGPDGALYIADFYNKIIGHYEVDLKHPGRDRHRGRIWRVVYTGTGAKPATLPDLSTADATALVAALGDGNPTVRSFAADQLTDRIGAAAAPTLTAMIGSSTNAQQRSHGLWTLFRLGAVAPAQLDAALTDKDAKVRAAAVGILAETAAWTPAQRSAVTTRLGDDEAQVRRAVADALGLHPHAEQLKPLLAALQAADQRDTHLVYKLRQALRDQVKDDAVVAVLPSLSLSPQDTALITDLATAAATPAAAKLVLARLTNAKDDGDTVLRQARHVARNLPAEGLPALVTALRARTDLDGGRHAALFAAVKEAYQQRGLPLDDHLRAWGGDVATAQLADADPARAMWSARAVPGAAASADPWGIQERQSSDGKKAPFLSSLPKGEQRTGILRSRAFAAPAKLSFFIAGHCGRPGTDDAVRNHLYLRDAATGEALKQIEPPRDDTAKPVEWDLAALGGRQVVIELVDGDTGSGYAWFAVGRFEPAVVNVDLPQGAWRAAAELARDARATSAAPALARLLPSNAVDDDLRVIAADALAAIAQAEHQPLILATLSDPQSSTALRGRLAVIAARHASPATDTALADLLRTSAWDLQVPVAAALAGNARGATLLIDLVTQGKAPARVLLERQVAERLTAQADLKDKIAGLTKNLPPVSAEKDKLITERIAAFRSAKLPADAITQGLQVFTVSCSLCHRIGGKGALVGPQLDGVGVRGPERLLEDILDPNRNVDHAFRQSILTLKDGQVALGMVRREEGETLVLADMTGKETTVAKNQIANRTDSSTSLMPDVFAHTVTQENMALLLSYLLSQR